MSKDQDYSFVRHQLNTGSAKQSLISDGEYGGLKFEITEDTGYRLEFDYSRIDTEIVFNGGDASNFWDCLIKLLKGEKLERAQEEAYTDGTRINSAHQLEEITDEEGLLDEELEEYLREFMEDYKLI